jgi:Host cell surface-exposed lipoprotein
MWRTSLLTTAALAAALVACGGDDDESTLGSGQTTSAVTDVATTTPPETTEAVEATIPPKTTERETTTTEERETTTTRPSTTTTDAPTTTTTTTTVPSYPLDLATVTANAYAQGIDVSTCSFPASITAALTVQCPIEKPDRSAGTWTVTVGIDQSVTGSYTETKARPLTPSQANAIRSAESYLEFMAFSRQGLIDQLSSEYGEQFPVADATFAVDSLNVDWNAQAVKSAESYLEFMAFSCQGLIDQLSSEFGDQFTLEQATYGATQVGLC